MEPDQQLKEVIEEGLQLIIETTQLDSHAVVRDLDIELSIGTLHLIDLLLDVVVTEH